MSEKSYRAPWDQQVDEPAKAYAAFLVYRGLGVGRTIKAVAQRYNVAERNIYAISSRFAWSFRADQWDAWALRHRSKAAEKRLLREADMESKTVNDALKMTRILVRRSLAKVRTDAKLLLTPSAAASLADTVVKLARLQRGEATSRSETMSRETREKLTQRIERVAKALQEREKSKKVADG